MTPWYETMDSDFLPVLELYVRRGGRHLASNLVRFYSEHSRLALRSTIKARRDRQEERVKKALATKVKARRTLDLNPGSDPSILIAATDKHDQAQPNRWPH